MATGGHSPPKKPEDWVDRARLELRNLTAAYRGQASNDVKIECALLAVEAALKACIWKREKWAAWPKRQAPFKFLYGHNFEGMLDRTGMRVMSFSINFGWPLGFFSPTAYLPHDFVLGGEGIGSHTFEVAFDAQGLVAFAGFLPGRLAAQYKLWPFSPPSP
jgi:hypothetical protein